MKYRIGIDIGGTNIKAGVVDDKYNLICKQIIETEAETPFEDVILNIVNLINNLKMESNLRDDDICMIGMGIPSCINAKTGVPVFANNTSWKERPIKEELEKYIKTPIFICNDADCALMGEKLVGAARNHDNVLMLTLGTGVGSSLLLNGKIYSGADGMGLEIGHIPLIHNGKPCTCGSQGCYEVYASVTGLICQTGEAMALNPGSLLNVKSGGKIDLIDGETAFECAALGDQTAMQVLDSYIEYVAHGVGGMINIFRPELVIIGGGICNEGDLLLIPLNEKTKKYVFAEDLIGSPPIVAAELCNSAGTIGAAHLDKFITTLM